MSIEEKRALLKLLEGQLILCKEIKVGTQKLLQYQSDSMAKTNQDIEKIKEEIQELEAEMDQEESANTMGHPLDS